MSRISPLTEKIIRDLSRIKKETEESEEIFKVQKTDYTPLKKLISWREEHLLKRNAIERALREELFSAKKIASEIPPISAESFFTALAHTGIFPNTVARSKISKLQEVLNKYAQIISHSPKSGKSKTSFIGWLVDIASCEIEEVLSEREEERKILFYTFRSLKNSINIKEEIEEKEKDYLLFIALQQTLFGLDHPTTTYHLLKLKSETDEFPEEEEYDKEAERLWKGKRKIDFLFKHPLLKKLYKFCKKRSAPYLVIKSILKENPEKAKEVFSQPEEVEEKIKNSYEKIEKSIRKKSRRVALYATVLVLMIRAAVFFTIEVHAGIERIEILPMFVNIFTPSLLMALIAFSVSPPHERNKKKVVLEAMKIIYRKKDDDKCDIEKAKKEKGLLYTLIGILYIFVFFLIAGAIFWALSLLNFLLFSCIIFMIFVSFASFAGIKIRESATDLHMIKKNNPLSFFVDILALPVAMLLRWINTERKKYGTFSILSGIFLEDPSKIFSVSLDYWREQLRKRKESIY